MKTAIIGVPYAGDKAPAVAALPGEIVGYVIADVGAPGGVTIIESVVREAAGTLSTKAGQGGLIVSYRGLDRTVGGRGKEQTVSWSELRSPKAFSSAVDSSEHLVVDVPLRSGLSPEIRETLTRNLLELLGRVNGADSDGQLEVLRAENATRKLRRLQEVKAESYSIAWLEGHGLKRRYVSHLRRAGRLLGVDHVPGVRGFVYPMWQFDDRLRPKPYVDRLILAAHEKGLDDLGLHNLMTDPAVGKDGRTLAEMADTDGGAFADFVVSTQGAMGT